MTQPTTWSGGPRPLRIGVLASIAHRTPPREYGPWEQVASTLAEGLVALGHEVTLFATADSRTAARLHAEAPRGYEEDPGVDAKVYEGLHNAAAFERADEFDVVSNQFDFMPLTYSRLVSTPVVTTVHGFSSERILPVYRAYDDIAHYVAISDADRHPDLTYDATIHHGIDLSPFTFRDQPGGYLLFLGRIHPDKGTHRAVAVARRAGLPLVIAGIVQDQDYFRALVEPHLGAPDISYVGPGRPGREGRAAGRRAGVAAPHRLRRTVRTLRRRIVGDRHAGDRVSARIDARDHPARSDRLPRRRPPGRGRGGR